MPTAQHFAALNDLLPLVRGIADRMTIPIGSSLSADDLFQVGSLAAWRAVETHRPNGASLRSWIFFRARGAMIDEIRRMSLASRRDAHAGRYVELADLNDFIPCPSRYPREDWKALLAPLDARERRAVLMWSAGHNKSEIARACGCSDPTASSLLVRAFARLRRAFGERGDGGPRGCGAGARK